MSVRGKNSSEVWELVGAARAAYAHLGGLWPWNMLEGRIKGVTQST